MKITIAQKKEMKITKATTTCKKNSAPKTASSHWRWWTGGALPFPRRQGEFG